MHHAEMPKLRGPIGRLIDWVRREPALATLFLCLVVVIATAIVQVVAAAGRFADTPLAAGANPQFVVEPRIVTAGYSLVVIREPGTGARVLVIEGATTTGRVAVALPAITPGIGK